MKINNIKKVKIQANLTCPYCKKEQAATMPTNACQYFYKCVHCGKIFKAVMGDCCVFCSYADTKCPSKQIEGGE